ncbi:MAG TPA: efflux RND transporter periplasmic adaptor subunit [Bryobacteraceae bacterium]|jgi:multidrug resistance efflux pump
MKKILLRLFIVALIGGASYAGYMAIQSLPKGEATIATATVQRGDVTVKSYARGELRAVRSATLIAPNLFGTVQVTKLSPLGAFAREKDLVVEFDDSEVLSRIEDKQLELDQIDEQIAKAQADLAIRNSQDEVELLSARFAVRRAELEVQRNELLAAIDQQKNKLNLEESKRHLQELESDVKSRREQALAELAVMQEKKNTGNLEMTREKARLQQVKLLAPISGLVAIRQNRTGFFFPGMQIPDVREGDQVQPGMPVADVLDLSEMEIVAKVGELDRANLTEGQEAELTLDALPEKKLKARIKSLSGTASSNAFSFDPAKRFDVVFTIDMQALLAALGAKPEAVRRILLTAEQNRRKRVETAIPAVAAAPASTAAPGAQMLGLAAPKAFTDQEMANAKLPPPAEEDTQFDVLLRPGLLADVSILIERVPNAIHVPMQAVFEREGKPVVYVKTGNRFDPREIKPAKRSESTMVIASGVKPGEIVALADPTKKESDKKEKGSGGGGAIQALPGAK